MKRTSLVRMLYLTAVSKPDHERAIYRCIRRLKANTVVEFGVGTGVRSRRLMTMLLRYHEPQDVQYVGIDLFEARPSATPGMTLKQAHRLLSETGGSVRLVPGDPFSALSRTANSLTGTDLIVIGADQDRESLQAAWFYLPRMLHDQSLVMLERTEGQGGFDILAQADVMQRAERSGPTRGAAA